MSIPSTRPYQNSAPQPFSPAVTTASSLNYSAYGAGGSSSAGLGGYAGRSAPASANKLAAIGRSESGLSQRSRSGKSETKETARIHWRALRDFLAAWLKDESPTARASAREKLTRLTKLQFQELSTDVYDELMRRQEAEQVPADQAGKSPVLAIDQLPFERRRYIHTDVPFLPVREDFHPKRNQARQKLATLPKNRFKDLASDVYFELKRRYPDFEQDEPLERAYEPPPAPGPIGRSGASSSLSDRRGPTPDVARLQSGHQRQGSRQMSASSQGTHRSRPSINHRERENEVETLHPQSQSQGYNQRGPSPVGATNEVVVPNKSRLREEEIEVPYARDSVLEPSPALRTGSRASQGNRDSQLSTGTSISTRQPNTAAPQDVLSPAGTDDARQYYDRMSFSSNVTNKSRMPNNRGEMDEEKEQRIRQEYEFKLVDLERRIGIVEQEREEARRLHGAEKDKRLEWEEEVRGLKERATTHASSLRSMQHEMDVQKDATDAARKMADDNVRAAEEETAQWRDRAESLEEDQRRLETENQQLRDQLERSGGASQEDAVTDLRKEVHSLVDELNALSIRNDELVAEREQDAVGMNGMEARVEEYRRKYDAVRIELRNLKATSTMFSPKPITEDHLPASPDGNIADVHVSAFQTGIDTLLTAARSSQPTGVLPAMKAVVEAITSIGEDVKAFEAQPNLDVDASRLESLKHESTTRLSQLMQAARNHAMSSGLSPISLLDGAAGHLSQNVVEIIKLLKIRRSIKLGRSRSSMSIKDMVGRDVRDVGNGLPTPPESKRDVQQVNGAWDREYGPSPIEPTPRERQLESEREREREPRGPSEMLRDDKFRASPVPINPPNMARAGSSASLRTHSNGRPALSPTPSFTAPQTAPTGIRNGQSPVPLNASSLRQLPGASLQEPPQPIRVNSYQSAASSHSQAKSDSFDLDRKASVISSVAGHGGSRTMVESSQGYLNGAASGTHTPQYHRYSQQADYRQEQQQEQQPSRPQPPQQIRRGRISDESSNSSMVGPITARSPSGPKVEPKIQQADEDDGHGYAENVGTEEEWDELKPYLNTQSSALVNSIQNLLAAIRTNQHTPALNEHLSEVIAIASSIVAVAGNALPPTLRAEGDALLKELVANTNKLSEAQEAAMSGQGQGGFGKETRQGIASASFGVAKGLKSLMKLGVE